MSAPENYLILVRIVMAKDARVTVDLECTECNSHRIQSEKRTKGENVAKRLELKKFCKICKKRTIFKETK